MEMAVIRVKSNRKKKRDITEVKHTLVVIL